MISCTSLSSVDGMPKGRFFAGLFFLAIYVLRAGLGWYDWSFIASIILLIRAMLIWSIDNPSAPVVMLPGEVAIFL
jgi:hypothetical protein